MNVKDSKYINKLWWITEIQYVVLTTTTCGVSVCLCLPVLFYKFANHSKNSNGNWIFSD